MAVQANGRDAATARTGRMVCDQESQSESSRNKSHKCYSLHAAVFSSPQPLCLVHTGRPTGVAVSHCIARFQTQLIRTTCQIRYHSHLWDHRSTGQL